MNGGRQKGIDLEIEKKTNQKGFFNDDKQMYSKKIITPNKKRETRAQKTFKGT